MAWKDTYSALAKRDVDAVEGTPSILYAAKIYRPSKYMTYLPIYYNPGIIVASPKMWKRLSDDERILLERCINKMIISIDKMTGSQTISSINNMKEFGASIEYPTELTPFRKAVEPIFKKYSKELPDYFRMVAYKTAYTKRKLRVCSRPDKAAVYYRRYGDKPYQLFHLSTDTDLYLEYAAWYIRVERNKHFSEEKLFDPYVSPEWRISFELKPKKP